MNKIIFLKNSNASLTILFNFIFTKIKNIFLKSQIKKFKKENINFLKNKQITHDYFSSHSYYFFSIFKENITDKVLEIGSFEGNSSMFLARYLRDSKIYCVDNWEGTEEYQNLNFKTLEQNFDNNIKEFNNIEKFKCKSDVFFKNNNAVFDLVYIDGYHDADQVMKDFKNSWKVLKKNGVIICDDYIWQFSKNIKKNPCYAINYCLNQLKDSYKILMVTNSQIFIKKI